MTLQDPAISNRNDDTPASFSTSVFLLGAISLGGFVGVMSPASSATLSRGIDITLLLMIFLLFFELRLSSLFSAVTNIRFLAMAWSANFLIIPIVGLCIASLFFSDHPVLFAGLMIYFLAPCTDWFLGFARLAKGDTELGATLIPVNIITQLLLFPFWLWLFANGAGLADLSPMSTSLLQWFLVPMIAAQGARCAAERLLPMQQRVAVMSWVSRGLNFVLAALIFQIFAMHIGDIAGQLDVAAMVAAAVLFFFIATFAVGEVLSRLGELKYPQRALLSMTMAARNGPLMLALTAIAVPDQPLILAVIVAAMLVEIPLLTALYQLLLKIRPER
ncbi:hypothetical protein QTO30_21360 [Yoonia sp. GPGPB17]|uniref:arsenic resistance protein n=1 Tax=Yoonia sp. GPGPB17 TaxID=3026147 RepID=UPI0030BE53EC